MTDDLIERLRDEFQANFDLYDEAADLIAAQQAEIERLREALLRIRDMKPHHAGQTANEYHMQEIARAALEGEK